MSATAREAIEATGLDLLPPPRPATALPAVDVREGDASGANRHDCESQRQ